MFAPKVLKNYPGYLVYPSGKIFSLKTNKFLKFGNVGRKNNDSFYKVVVLKNYLEQVETVRVHRLVAEAFLPNPNNYPCVNHKDETRINNHVDNLEWCSYSYNNTYGTVKERCVKTYSKNHSRPVEMLSLSGEFLKTFKSVKEAALFIKGTVSSIERALNKTRKTAYGYIWNLI